MKQVLHEGVLGAAVPEPARIAVDSAYAATDNQAMILPVAVATMFGAFVGSFLNVCVHRLPRNESVVTPPSRCYGCGARVRWYDNLPILSYLILRGRCRWCDSRFSPRYLVMEALVAALTGLALWSVLSGHLPPASWLIELVPIWLAQALTALSLCCLAWFLVVATLIDLEHLIIPDELTKSFQLAAPLLAMIGGSNVLFGWDVGPWLVHRDVFGVQHLDGSGFLVRFLGIVGGVLVLLLITVPMARWVYSRYCPEHERWRPEDHRGFRIGVLWYVAVTALVTGLATMLVLFGGSSGQQAGAHLAQAILGSLAGWCSLYVVGLVGTMVFRKNAMGFGDVKFLAPIGAWLGPVGVVLAFFGAAIAGAAVGIPMYLAGGRRHIPFGPYLALGAVAALAFGPGLTEWFLSRL